MELMKIDPVPVWRFFEIPDDAIEKCHAWASRMQAFSKEYQYWKRAAVFLETVKTSTVDKLPERDFDWMLKLRVQIEKEMETDHSEINFKQ